jgi:Tol biopolymer transport system component
VKPSTGQQEDLMRKLTVLAAALTTLGLAGISGPAQAKAPGPDGQIVFSRSLSSTTEDFAVVTVNPDGTHVQELTAGECPHWSPDGSLIATCGSPGGGASAIINPDTGTIRELFPPDLSLHLACPVWSPDAQRLACGQFDSAADPSRDGMYTIRSSDGGGLRRITSNPGGLDEPGDYSPDGAQIVFGRTDPARPANAAHALFVVHLDGTGLHRITPWGPGSEADGSWSPNGRSILFDTKGSLYVVHPDGTGLAKITLATSSLSRAFGPGWSPGGTKIVFALFTRTSPGTGQEGIYTANADGSHLQQVTNAPIFDEHPDWGTHPLAS